MDSSRALQDIDKVQHPHAFWWVIVLGGLTLLAFMAFSAGFYAWWEARVYDLPEQATLMWIFIACGPIHVYEAVYVYRKAMSVGMIRSARAWSFQTFMLGFPSTYLFNKRVRALSVAGASV